MEAVAPASLDPARARRVVVLGGGYAGMTFVNTLAHGMRASDEIELVLVTPLPYQEALSELDLVAAGTPRPQWAELWHGDVFRNLPVRVVYDRVESVRPGERAISVGPRGSPRADIGYWRLVIATGAVPRLPPVPGLAEHAVTMWAVGDALELQRRIERQFEIAATLPDPEARRHALSVTVVGGGATGIEIIGTVAAVMPRHIGRAGYDPSLMSLTLLEGRPDILYDLPGKLRGKAAARLRSMGVELVLGEVLAQVQGGVAVTATGRRIPSSVLVWCGGARADPDATGWDLATDASGRLVSGSDLKAAGHDDIYVVGDVASFRDPSDGSVLPMLAQFAIREAAHAAGNILHEARREPTSAFEPHQHGEFVSVGPRWGVGWMFGWTVSGRFAIVMKRLTYIMYWLQVGSYRLAWRRTRQMLRLHR